MKKTLFARDWMAKRSVIILMISGWLVLISGVAIFLGHKQFQSTLGKALVLDSTVANMTAMVLQEHAKATLGILQSYASRPLFVSSVKRKDAADVQWHLADLKRNNTEMDLTFLTDRNGILWANYPVFPEAIGRDLSDRDWYKGISSNWQPYISTVFKLIVGSRPLAVAVCVPVLDEKGDVVGILANSHRLGFISDIFKRLPPNPDKTISMIDQAGNILYSNMISTLEQVTGHPLFQDIEQAVKEGKTLLELNDPQKGQGKRFLAISPIEGMGWAVIVERSWDDTFHSEYKRFFGIAAIAFLLFFLVAVFIVYQYSLYRKTAEVLQTERQLRASETRYKHLLENIPDILYTYSSLRSGIYHSPQVESVLGYTDDYLRNHPGLWHDSIHPDDLPAVNQAIKNSTTGQRIETEYRIRDAQGQWHWFYDRSVSITNEAGETLISGLASDITERKQAEEVLRESQKQLRDAHKLARIGVWNWIADTDTVTWSEELYHIAALDPMIPAPTYAEHRDIYTPESWARLKVSAQKALETGAPYQLELELIRPDGSIRWVNAFGRVIYDAQGRIKGLHGTVQDITERKQDEKEKAKLEAQNRQLQKSESLGVMAGAIAHHFNNLLGGVMGNLEMALEDLPRDAATVKSLTAARQAARKAAEVSGQMLIYLGQTTGMHTPLDLSESCRQSLPLLQATVPKSMTLQADLPSPGPTISANANQILQVLTNLTTNAWEAIDENQGTVNLTVKMVSAADIPSAHRFPFDWQPQNVTYACLEVTDTGCGIAEEDIDKVFDPFFSSKFAGRGLGLSVALGIVKTHNGAVTVESGVGRGSSFRVFFPVSAEEAPRQPEKTIRPLPREGGGTVLLVDDEEILRDMAATMLTRLGYTVLAAKDGVEAVEIFTQHQEEIRCVVSDLTMPRMNGWQTLTALRRLSPGIPVILSSGYDEAQALLGDHPERPQVFLHKPYQKSALQAALAKAMEGERGEIS